MHHRNFFLITSAVCADLRLWAGAHHGARREGGHDTGSRHAVLPRARDPHGRRPLHKRGRSLVGRLHLRGAAQPQDSLPGLCPCTAGKRALVNADRGRHPTCWCYKHVHSRLQSLYPPTLLYVAKTRPVVGI